MASTDTAQGATAKVGGKQLTWSQLVAKVGETKARSAAPELDPEYQKLVASEGQAKGSADYTAKFVDPSTVTAQGWSGLGGGKEIDAGIKDELNSDSPDLRDLGSVGQDIMHPLGGTSLSTALGLKDAPSTPAAPPKPTAPPETAAQKATAAQAALSKQQQAIANSPAEQLMNGLIGDYQTAMKSNEPYMNGSAGQAAVAKADSMSGDSVGDPSAQAMLTGDAANVGAAQQAGSQGVTSALQNMGTANAEALQVAPYQALLTSLQSEAQYKTETGTGAAAPANAPAWYKQAMADVGEGTASGTTVPGDKTAATNSATTPSSDTGDNIGGS
jgi:hypothetical protein